MVVASQVLGIGEAGRPAGSRGHIISVGRGGVMPSYWNRHGDDQRDEAVVSGPLAVQALCVGGAPRPVGLLKPGRGEVRISHFQSV